MARLKHVVITVTAGRIGLGGGPVTVSRKAQEQVCWHCPQGTATIALSPSPFASERFVVPRGGSTSSGPVIEAPGDYTYSLEVRLDGDRRRYACGPRLVIVD